MWHQQASRSIILKLNYWARRLRHVRMDQRQLVIVRISRLVKQLSTCASRREIKHILSSILLSCGLFLTEVQAQNFAPPLSKYDFEMKRLFVPELGDLDGDGDLDMIGLGNYNGLNIAFIENIGTAESPIFSTPVIDPFAVDFEHALDSYFLAYWELADFDSDGDLDMLSLAYSNDQYRNTLLVFVENFGDITTPDFRTIRQTTIDLGFLDISQPVESSFADMDRDGDLDMVILSSLYSFNSETQESELSLTHFYLENISTENTIAFAQAVNAPFDLQDILLTEETGGSGYTSYDILADFDGDGDSDLVVVQNGFIGYAGPLIWYSENLGNSEFSGWSVLDNLSNEDGSNYFALPTSGDIDGDGDIDILFTRYNQQYAADDLANLIFIENLGVTSSVDEVAEVVSLSIYPSVVQVTLQIHLSGIEATPIYASIIDGQGRVVIQFDLSATGSLDVSSLLSGSYQVVIIHPDGVISEQFIKE